MAKLIFAFLFSLQSCSPAFATTAYADPTKGCEGKMFCMEFAQPTKQLYMPWYEMVGGLVGAAVVGALLADQQRSTGALIGTAALMAGIIITLPIAYDDPIVGKVSK